MSTHDFDAGDENDLPHTDKEAIYDEQIAPLMTQVISIAKEHKIQLHFTAYLDDGLYCTTHLDFEDSAEPQPLALLMMRVASQAKDNFDALVMAFMRRAREEGHSSAVLWQLGIPMEPGGKL